METDDTHFDEVAYLSRYKDVAIAVTRGTFKSAYEHYEKYGRAEGRNGAEPSEMPNVVDLPQHSRVETFESPGFTTHPPELRNGDLLSPALRQRYNKLWYQVRPAHEITCSVIESATVVGQGLVFDRDLNLIRQTIHQATSAEIEAAARRVREYAIREPSASEAGTTLLCEKSGTRNYGHWLVEMLPIAYLCSEKICSGWNLRLPVTVNANMNAVILESCVLLGIPASQQRTYSPKPTRYERLAIVTGLSQHGIYYSPIVVDCLERLASTVSAGATREVWVSRVKEPRRLECEAEICERLAAAGWFVAEPAQMTLREQISVFKSASRIAGVNGAGLTNLAFAPCGVDVTSFMPAAMPDVFFWMLAGFKKHQYTEVRCCQRLQSDWNSTLLLTASEVEAFLK